MNREEAIKNIKEHCYFANLIPKAKEALDIAIEALEQEPKTGHWIDGHCSKCGCDVPAYVIDWKWQKDMDAKFCPNCGRRMREVD